MEVKIRNTKTLIDPHYPRYHLAPRQGWLNDPHPLYFKGAYHMFYQYSFIYDYPYGGSHCWGHAVSRDLVHWEHLPPAITLKDHGSADGVHIWSGCMVDNDGVGTAIYTMGNIDVWVSTSADDDLRVFKKHEVNPVIKGPPPEQDILREMRDPWVWKEADGWYLIAGSGLKDDRGSVLPLYKSTDLVHWQYLHPLYLGDASQSGPFCECPAFFPLGDKHVLFLGNFPRTTYFVGRYENHRFIPEKRGQPGCGQYYVPQTLLDGKGRRILWAWAMEPRDKDAQQQAGWASMQTLPQVVSLAADNTLRLDPVQELEVLRGEHHRADNLTVGNTPVPIQNGGGMQVELKVVFTPGSAQRFGLLLQDKEELLRVTYDAGAQVLHCKVRPAGPAPDPGEDWAYYQMLQCREQGTPLALDPGEDLTLRVFIDRSIVEVFANRKVFVVERIYPLDVSAVEVTLFAESGQARVKQVDAWQMASIWDALDDHCAALEKGLWWLLPETELQPRLVQAATVGNAVKILATMVSRQKQLTRACRSAAKGLCNATQQRPHPWVGRAGPARRGRLGEPSLPMSPASPKAAWLSELLRRIDELGLADAAYGKMLARTLKELPKDLSWPLVVSRFKVSRLQPPMADIADACPPRPGLARQVVPFAPGLELADIRGFHDGADGVLYIEAAVRLAQAYRGALAYGADGPVKVWVNGRAVDCRPQTTNPARIGEYVTPVSWKKGVNRIVFALATNQGRAWGVQARVLRSVAGG